MSNHQDIHVYIKFMFFKKATKIDKIFKSQIDGEDFVNFCGLFRKHELYQICKAITKKFQKTWPQSWNPILELLS